MILNLPPSGPAKNRAGFFWDLFLFVPSSAGRLLPECANQDRPIAAMSALLFGSQEVTTLVR